MGAKNGAVAKVFWSGRSQAVRLPKLYRLEGNEVHIRKQGQKLVLEPLEEQRDVKGWPLDFWELFGMLDEDFDLGDRDKPLERENLFKD